MSPTEKQALSPANAPPTGPCEFALVRTRPPFQARNRSRSAAPVPDPGPITNQGCTAAMHTVNAPAADVLRPSRASGLIVAAAPILTTMATVCATAARAAFKSNRKLPRAPRPFAPEDVSDGVDHRRRRQGVRMIGYPDTQGPESAPEPTNAEPPGFAGVSGGGGAWNVKDGAVVGPKAIVH